MTLRSSVEGTREGAVERALDVLEALAANGPAASLADIAERACVPKSTAHRILQTLARRDYARQLGDGAYAPGFRVLSLAGEIEEALNLAELAGPAMRKLQHLVPETVHLALLDGDHATYVAKLEGLRAYRMASRIGTNLALHCTAIGKAILAHLPEDQREGVLGRGPLPRRTDRTITDPRSLAEELGAIRARAFSIDDEENEQAIRCVGAAVFDRLGRVIGGLSLSAPAFALSNEQAYELGPAVVLAASAVSVRLGARPEQLPALYPR